MCNTERILLNFNRELCSAVKERQPLLILKSQTFIWGSFCPLSSSRAREAHGCHRKRGSEAQREREEDPEASNHLLQSAAPGTQPTLPADPVPRPAREGWSGSQAGPNADPGKHTSALSVEKSEWPILCHYLLIFTEKGKNTWVQTKNINKNKTMWKKRHLKKCHKISEIFPLCHSPSCDWKFSKLLNCQIRSHLSLFLLFTLKLKVQICNGTFLPTGVIAGRPT